MSTTPIDEASRRSPAPDPDVYEAPCIVDVDTESQPAATAAMIATNPD